MKKILQINENSISVINLKDILGLLPLQYSTWHWSLFEIEAIGDLGEDRSMPEFEDEVFNQLGGML